MLYIPVAIIIGLIQATDSFLLLQNDGKPSKFNYFTSTIEFMWVFISAVFLFTYDAGGMHHISAIIFISYVATTFLVGTFMMKDINDAESLADIRVPAPFLKLGIGFGVLYAKFNFILFVF